MKTKTRQFVCSSFYFALVFLFSASAARAETISAYQTKIERAKTIIGELLYGDDDQVASGVKTAPSERNLLRQLRQTLPPSERVESGAVSVETQNRWFAERLDDYEKESDPAKRRLILSGIADRLDALETAVGEFEKPVAAAAARAKDEDKQKLAEILSRPEYQKPAPPEENILQRIWHKFLEWLGSVFPKISPFSIPEGGLSALSFILQILVYALVLGGIGFLIYKFAPFLARKFGRGVKETKTERVILGETLAAAADSRTLFAEAENLARAGNLRAAIRKGYIALLCDLSDRKIIGLAKNKTNRDYLRDVRPRAEIFQEMKGLTTNFERNWYGRAATVEKDWNDFREKYKLVSEQLRATN